jgi:hypothetical protein
LTKYSPFPPGSPLDSTGQPGRHSRPGEGGSPSAHTGGLHDQRASAEPVGVSHSSSPESAQPRIFPPSKGHRVPLGLPKENAGLHQPRAFLPIGAWMVPEGVGRPVRRRPGALGPPAAAALSGPLGLFDLGPFVFQRYRAVEDQPPARGIGVHAEIALPLELEDAPALGSGQAGLYPALG